MRIGELAKRAGLSPSKVRFYEGRGLMAPTVRLANGFRDYDEHALEVLVFIGRAQRLGFTLREIAAHLRSPQDDERKARLQAGLEAKLTELDVLAEQLRDRRRVLVDLIQEVRTTRGNPAQP